MNKTETLSNGNSTIIVLINYNQRAIHVYKILYGKFNLQQKMYLESDWVRTYMIYNQFYLLSVHKGEFFFLLLLFFGKTAFFQLEIGLMKPN